MRFAQEDGAASEKICRENHRKIYQKNCRKIRGGSGSGLTASGIVWTRRAGPGYPRPSLTFENISYLLANYLTEQNMYQYEEYDVISRLEEDD